MGNDPFKKKRELTPEQKLELRARLASKQPEPGQPGLAD
jgi:hypothetical protein